MKNCRKIINNYKKKKESSSNRPPFSFSIMQKQIFDTFQLQEEKERNSN